MVNDFINSNTIIKNEVFYISDERDIPNRYYNLDIDSFNYLKEFLIKENCNNKYIIDDTVDVNILKSIALSNNDLVIVDRGNITEIHKALSNKIIKEDDFKKESF